jgi:hypothetical protein
VEDAAKLRRGRQHRPFRSRRLVPPTAEGRWSLVHGVDTAAAFDTDWAAATAQQLLTRHGVITRETVASESIAGGFTAVYDVLKAMEDAGRVRAGYFVAGLGAAQFAMPAALDRLRSFRDTPDDTRTVVLAATDPANPYGSIVKVARSSARPAWMNRRVVRRAVWARARYWSTAQPPVTSGEVNASSSCSCRRRSQRARRSCGRSHGR